jgi:hypothetical protein
MPPGPLKGELKLIIYLIIPLLNKNTIAFVCNGVEEYS